MVWMVHEGISGVGGIVFFEVRFTPIRAITVVVIPDDRCFFVMNLRRMVDHDPWIPAIFVTSFQEHKAGSGQPCPGCCKHGWPDHVLLGCRALRMCFHRALSSRLNHKYRLHRHLVKRKILHVGASQGQTGQDNRFWAGSGVLSGLRKGYMIGTTPQPLNNISTSNKYFLQGFPGASRPPRGSSAEGGERRASRAVGGRVVRP